MPETLAIVIPSFNEAKRLPASLQQLVADVLNLEQMDLRLEKVFVVDDGSRDETALVAASFQTQLPIEVVRYDQNRGKGYAIRTGAKLARTDLILIADADMSTPWPEIEKLLVPLHEGADVAIASRSVAESQIDVRQPWYRERMGKTFNLLMRMITWLPFRDTQCGFKLVKTERARFIWDNLEVNRFAWDIEFLIWSRALGLKIVERGVRWNHRDESRVHPVKDSLEMLFCVLKIRGRMMLPSSFR